MGGGLSRSPLCSPRSAVANRAFNVFERPKREPIRPGIFANNNLALTGLAPHRQPFKISDIAGVITARFVVVRGVDEPSARDIGQFGILEITDLPMVDALHLKGDPPPPFFIP